MPEENVTPPVSSHTKNSLGIPIAIVIAAALIAGAIYMSGIQGSSKQAANVDVQKGIDAAQNPQVTPEIAPVTKKDHIRGNPNAPIVIVEYSDYDCPYCKLFHDTMNKIMADYGASGQVAWVYRQHPIAQLHPNAPMLSASAKCVAEQGGNDAFWKYTDAVFASRKPTTLPSGQQTISFVDTTKLRDFAVESGVDGAKFDSCLASGKFDAEVQEDVKAAGQEGTPYSVLMYNGQQGVINGAQPYETVKQIITTILAQGNGAEATPATN